MLNSQQLEDFDRDGSIQADIGCTKYDAHSAVADELVERIVLKDFADEPFCFFGFANRTGRWFPEWFATSDDRVIIWSSRLLRL